MRMWVFATGTLMLHYMCVDIGIGDCFLESDAEDTRADLVKLAEWKALESSAKVGYELLLCCSRANP